MGMRIGEEAYQEEEGQEEDGESEGRGGGGRQRGKHGECCRYLPTSTVVLAPNFKWKKMVPPLLIAFTTSDKMLDRPSVTII
jgi:hypothetical protein